MHKLKVTHAAHDRGTEAAIQRATALGGQPPLPLPVKTTALCGRRVRAVQINNQAPTCPQCREWCERAEG